MLLGAAALVVLLLVLAGIVIGWTIGNSDSQIEILAKRLAAEHRIEMVTRDAIHAMRDAARRRA